MSSKLSCWLDDTEFSDPFVKGCEPVTPMNVADHIYAAIEDHATERDSRGRATTRAMQYARWSRMWSHQIGFRGSVIADVTQTVLRNYHAYHATGA